MSVSNCLILSIHRTFLIFVIVLSTIGCDQTTKLIARDTLSITGPLSYLNDNVRFELAQNPGAFLSYGANLPDHLRIFFFNVGVAIAMLVLGLYLLRDRKMQPSVVLALSLIFAGGTGNLIDRIMIGSVTDFMIVGVGRVSTGIFNIADVAVVIGVLVLLLTNTRDRQLQG